jgi:hypothetical protein
VKRHASAEELACLAEDVLGRRKSRQIRAHLAICSHCTLVSRELTGVSVLLSKSYFPAMPDHLSVRLDATISAEARLRTSQEPATEASRGELPARKTRQAPGKRARQRLSGWLSGPGIRVVAAAGALAIIVAGGYEIASHTPGGSTNGAASAPGNAGLGHPAGGGLTFGPSLSYRHGNHQDTIRTVAAATNFVPSKMRNQVASAMGFTTSPSAASGGQAANPPSATATSGQGSPAPLRSEQDLTKTPFSSFHGIPITRLMGCVDAVAAGHTVLLVELANFEGKAATIIVVAAKAANHAVAWVVGTSCGPLATDVLYHLSLARI